MLYNVKPAVDGNENGNGTLGGSNGSTASESETHECFVFISNKLASDITLTIGQAFDLAYRKYINSAEKTDLGKAQQQISELEKNLALYRNRLLEVSLKIPKPELEAMLLKMGMKYILELPSDSAAITNGNSVKLSKKIIYIQIKTDISKSMGLIKVFICHLRSLCLRELAENVPQVLMNKTAAIPYSAVAPLAMEADNNLPQNLPTIELVLKTFRSFNFEEHNVLNFVQRCAILSTTSSRKFDLKLSKLVH